MAASEQLITDNLDIWSAALMIKSAAGRGKTNKLELYGIKKLRMLILDLAVRGLLVPQDLKDEPISRNELALRKPPKKQPTGRTGADLGPVTCKETGMSLPESWIWGRMFQLCQPNAPIVYGILQPGPDIRPNGVPYIRPTEIKNSQIQLDNIRHTSEDIAKKYERSTISTGDIIMTIVGTLGATAIVPEELDGGNITQSSCRLRTDEDLILPDFLVIVLESPLTTSQINRFKLGTAVERLNIAHVRALPVPLPPLAEQERIVTKVKEMITICERLEEQKKTNFDVHKSLVESLLNVITTTSKAEEFISTWSRISDNFDSLFTTYWSIEQLKKTILQLAVMGKLVSQDSNDEPANELIKKITAEKNKLVKEGLIKNQKKIPIEDNKIPYLLPESWCWMNLPECYSSISPSNKKLKSSKIQESGKYPVVDQGQNRISGFSNDKNLVIKIPQPLIVFGDHTRNVKYIDFDFVPGADGIKILCPIIVNPRYFYLYVKHYNLEDRGYARHFKVLNENLIALPPLEEQQRIVDKVEDLMTICNSLKTCINKAQTTQLKLADVMSEQVVL